MTKPTQAQIKRATEVVEGYLEQQLANMRNKTIERCAQEIEGRYFKHINDAAVAIRALKDKP